MPGIQVLWLPLLVAVNLLFACSIGLLLATLNVFIRDTGQVVPVVMQALFWLTPVVYMLSILPERLQHYFKLNPLYPLVTGYQNVLVFNTPPPLSSLADLCVVSLLIMSFALFLFRKAVVEMVDVL
jgi:lipopolysaccharide transport system permease protein